MIAKIFLFIILVIFILWLINICLVKYQCNKIYREAKRYGVEKDFWYYVSEYSCGVSDLKMDVVYRIALNQALTPKE